MLRPGIRAHDTGAGDRTRLSGVRAMGIIAPSPPGTHAREPPKRTLSSRGADLPASGAARGTARHGPDLLRRLRAARADFLGRCPDARTLSRWRRAGSLLRGVLARSRFDVRPRLVHCPGPVCDADRCPDRSVRRAPKGASKEASAVTTQRPAQRATRRAVNQAWSSKREPVLIIRIRRCAGDVSKHRLTA